eukprot:scaffold8151_cov239-Pinguiococcus_pyrenoidosus.AAC.1
MRSNSERPCASKGGWPRLEESCRELGSAMGGIDDRRQTTNTAFSSHVGQNCTLDPRLFSICTQRATMRGLRFRSLQLHALLWKSCCRQGSRMPRSSAFRSLSCRSLAQKAI